MKDGESDGESEKEEDEDDVMGWLSNTLFGDSSSEDDEGIFGFDLDDMVPSVDMDSDGEDGETKKDDDDGLFGGLFSLV